MNTKNITSIIWDQTILAQERAQDLLASGISETYEDAFALALMDCEFISHEFERFMESFGGTLNEISPEGLFFVQGRNVGWRHLSGALFLQACDADQYIDKAFPRTSEWSFYGRYCAEEKKLEYTLFHHDAPIGEFYTLVRDLRTGL